MRSLIKFGSALAVVGTLAISACGGSDASSDTNAPRTKNAALVAPELQLSKYESIRTITGISGNVRGIATDGKKLFVRTSDNPNGVIYETGFDGLNTVKHTVTNPPGDVDGAQANLAMSHGCIWTSSHGGNLYCTDTKTWTAAKIEVPADKPLPSGQFWMSSDITDFPDGRIARISAPTYVGGKWQSTLRVYNVTGTGTAATIAWDRDFSLTDTSQWPTDDHGIATDGRYLVRIRYAQGYKVWDLQAGSSVPVYFDANGTGVCGLSGTLCPINPAGFSNATYIAHDHVNARYLVGDYDRQQYYYTVQGELPVVTTTTVAPSTTEAVVNQQVVTTTAAPATTAAPTTTAAAASEAPATTTAPTVTQPVANELSVSVKLNANIPLTSIIQPNKGAKNLKWSVTGTCTISASNLVAPASATTCKVKLIQTVKKKVQGKTKSVKLTRTATVVVM